MVSKYICFDCFVRIFLRAAAYVGDRGVVTWHDFTWRGQGYIFLLPPHPPTWSCTYVRLFRPTWSRGVGGVQLLDFTWCMGAWPTPIHRLGRARALPFANTIFNSQIIISNYLNVKSNFITAVWYMGDVQNHLQ